MSTILTWNTSNYRGHILFQHLHFIRSEQKNLLSIHSWQNLVHFQTFRKCPYPQILTLAITNWENTLPGTPCPCAMGSGRRWKWWWKDRSGQYRLQAGNPQGLTAALHGQWPGNEVCHRHAAASMWGIYTLLHHSPYFTHLLMIFLSFITWKGGKRI